MYRIGSDNVRLARQNVGSAKGVSRLQWRERGWGDSGENRI